ncbi:hypothetical protein C8J57DRAFT_1223072 [Mycena rebaudengoi]|nr:hypothetical protein C8J57DRAFT_1223072 [Mycena rebaudengoi]
MAAMSSGAKCKPLISHGRIGQWRIRQPGYHRPRGGGQRRSPTFLLLGPQNPPASSAAKAGGDRPAQHARRARLKYGHPYLCERKREAEGIKGARRGTMGRSRARCVMRRRGRRARWGAGSGTGANMMRRGAARKNKSERDVARSREKGEGRVGTGNRPRCPQSHTRTRAGCRAQSRHRCRYKRTNRRVAHLRIAEVVSAWRTSNRCMAWTRIQIVLLQRVQEGREGGGSMERNGMEDGRMRRNGCCRREEGEEQTGRAIHTSRSGTYQHKRRAVQGLRRTKGGGSGADPSAMWRSAGAGAEGP